MKINWKYFWFGYPGYEENFFKRIFRMFRREYYLRFKKDYVKQSLNNRKGKCKGCGCCGTSPIICEHHDYKTNRCTQWNKKKFGCLAYPFDEKDKILFSKVNCGFYWD